jgi:hypothetical protein
MYKPAVNISSMSTREIGRLTPGQWVKTCDSDRGPYIGRFWGVKPSGVVVVAWQGNAQSQKNYWQYQTALRRYAAG